MYTLLIITFILYIFIVRHKYLREDLTFLEILKEGFDFKSFTAMLVLVLTIFYVIAICHLIILYLP